MSLFEKFFGFPEIEKAYENKVEQARKTESDEILENLSITHAYVVVHNLFQMAAEKGLDVKIVSGTLNAECYNEELTKLARKILDNGNNIEVLYTLQPKDSEGNLQKLDKSSPFYKLISEKKCFLKHADEDAKHFIIVGDQAFRVETNTHIMKAYLSFNSPIATKHLQSIFTRLKAEATQKSSPTTS